ncbi:MAG: hypothetical protein ACFCUI_03405 [Bernardetiaceae bacterium]
MVIKTKKYQLPAKLYIRLSFFHVMREWWWVWTIPVLILVILSAFGYWGWGIGIALTLSVLYILFWLAQFAAVTQHENTKVLFDRFSYEITSRQILIKLDEKRAMPIQWDKIQTAQMGKDHFLLRLSRVQLIYLPFNIFREHDIKFMEMILKRKKLLPSAAAEPKDVAP